MKRNLKCRVGKNGQRGSEPRNHRPYKTKAERVVSGVKYCKKFIFGEGYMVSIRFCILEVMSDHYQNRCCGSVQSDVSSKEPKGEERETQKKL